MWWSAGERLCEITQRLNDMSVQVTKAAVQNCIKRFEETGSAADGERSGRPRTLTPEEDAFLDALVEVDCEVSSVELRDKVQVQFGKGVSLATVSRVRTRLGWTRSRVLYGQLIRNKNKAARLSYALRMYEIEEDFGDMIFSDESSFWVENNSGFYYRRVGSPRMKKGKPKHPAKVHVWAGISRRGATKLAIFDGIMRKEFYTDTLLAQYLLPFIQTHYPEGCRFMQDNDPKHTSRYAVDFMQRNNITWWKTPAESPDINPIEHVWGHMKMYIRRVSYVPCYNMRILTIFKEIYLFKKRFE